MKGFPLIFISTFLFLLPINSLAKSLNIWSFDELVRAGRVSNCTLVVNNDIDLYGQTVNLSKGCVLKFKRGSLRNGTLIGDGTKIKTLRENVLHNCTILGEWEAECVYSMMFDDDVEAMTLLRNMAKISPILRLSANRDYYIHAQGQSVNLEVMEGDGKKKPKLNFHTTDPNVPGIVLVGNHVTLRNLNITDDYSEKNDAEFGTNKPTVGNTIAVKGLNNTVETLTIEGCDFRGGTSSSFVASSQTKHCLVKDCSFTGYMADHGVYCSVKAETFRVENCQANDVTHVSGLFKVRTSEKLSQFSICGFTAHNYHGYLAMVSLLETPEAEVKFKQIYVTKDKENGSVFYGFCMNDETKSLSGRGYNADCITVSNCHFGYGYEGNAVIYSGAGKRVCAREVTYDHVEANESNFGGAVADKIKVMDSQFLNCTGDKGIYLSANELTMSKCNLYSKLQSNCLFLVNHNQQRMRSMTLQDVNIDANTSHIINIASGNNVGVRLNNCRLVRPNQNYVKAPSRFMYNLQVSNR